MVCDGVVMQAGFGTVYAVRRVMAGSGLEWDGQAMQATLGDIRSGSDC